MKAPLHAFGTAHLEQVRADLRALEAVGPVGSVRGMLLLGAYEKLAKAHGYRSGAFLTPRVSHIVVAAWTRNLRRGAQPALEIAFGPGYPASAAWDEISSALQRLEQASPSHPTVKGKGPHLEYPWDDGTPRVPERDLEIARQLCSPDRKLFARLLKLAQVLARDFDVLFPLGPAQK